MSRLNRKQLRKMLLKEFKMLGMKPMSAGMIGHSPYNDHDHDELDDISSLAPSTPTGSTFKSDAYGHEGTSSSLKRVSREDCCAAILCLIECCTCEETKMKLQAVCDDLMLKKDSTYSTC